MAEFPKLLKDWEAILCRHYLQIGDSGNLLPITSFEVTSWKLAEITVGRSDDISAKSAYEAFRGAFDVTRTRRALQEGVFANTIPDLPGCFSYLALTLLIENALDDENEGAGQFRNKLALFLRCDRINVLSGIAEMWRYLNNWLASRNSRKGDYRLLQLPDEGPWYQIGYTKRLAFPTKRDLTRGRSLLEGRTEILGRPTELIGLFDRYLSGKQASPGLVDAFKAFKNAYLSQNRALAHFDFWRFVNLCSLIRSDEEVISSQAVIEAARDEDRFWRFSFHITSDHNRLRHGLLSDLVSGNGNLRLPPTVAKGFLVFVESGLGRWRSVGSIDECLGKVIVAGKDNIMQQLRLGDTQTSGNWCITREPIKIGNIESALQRAGLSAGEREEIIGISFEDGIRSEGVWLGRQGLLPIIVGAQGILSIHSTPNSIGKISASLRRDGAFVIHSEEDISGEFFLELRFNSQDIIPYWSRRLTFVKDALLHKQPPANSDNRVMLKDWDGDVSFGSTIINKNELSWDDTVASDNLIEALYALGTRLRAENELITIIRRAFPKVNPWIILKLLQDSALIRPYLRKGWRGCDWLIVPPGLTSVSGEENCIFLVNGVIGSRLAAIFKGVVESCGGVAFRRVRSGHLSLALFGFYGGDPHMIAERLGWSIANLTSNIPYMYGNFSETTRRILVRPEKEYWDWDKQAFTDIKDYHRYSIEKFLHPNESDHDVYLATSEGKCFYSLSRVAAICWAYKTAKKPLFALGINSLDSLFDNARLPSEIALALRQKYLQNPIVDNGLLKYTATYEDLSFLCRLLGDSLQSEVVQRFSQLEIIEKSRRKNNSSRLVWSGNMFDLIPNQSHYRSK